jgi:imidazolonepropionase-like amidohydrolase
LKTLYDSGVGIVFGTDSGPPARFQGYFEHLEMEMMAAAGLPPAAVLYSATAGAAECLGLTEVGVLESGRLADFLVLKENPAASIRALRTIESTWVGGKRLAGGKGLD